MYCVGNYVCFYLGHVICPLVTFICHCINAIYTVLKLMCLGVNKVDAPTPPSFSCWSNDTMVYPGSVCEILPYMSVKQWDSLKFFASQLSCLYNGH